jgi:hypothetical protein
MSEWFVQHGGKIHGPMSPGQLKQLATASKISPATNVRLGMDGRWTPARNVKGLFVTEPVATAPPPPPPVIVEPVRYEPVPTPRLESGHVAHAPSVNVHLPKRTSSLGVASLVLGIVAFLLCWIPFIGILTIPIAALGALFGGIGFVVALVRRGSGIGYPIAGGVICGLALMIGVGQVGVIGATVSAIDEVQQRGVRTNQEAIGATGPKKEWASARSPVRQGDTQVRITAVRIGPVKLKDTFSGGGDTSTSYLSINLDIANLSQSKKIDYKTWQGADFSFGRDYASLRDNHGNVYKRIDFGFGSDIVGQTKADAMYPGKSISDTLVFELPIDNIQHLDLELPAANLGGDGMFRLRIPADMVQR